MEPPTQTFVPGTVGVASSKVELTVSARNLLDMDTFSKSDPMCVLFIKEFGSDNFIEFGRTEVIWNNLNPNFVKKFVMEYYFEQRQVLKFSLFDIDSKSHDLSKHDFLGSMECSLAEVVSNGRLKRPLKGPKADSGSILAVSSEEMSQSKEVATLEFHAEKLDKKDFFGKSDPFLRFWKSNEDGSYVICHETEVIKSNLNPRWRRFTAKMTGLCNGDLARQIKIECHDWNRSGSHELIGECTTTFGQLARGPGAANRFDLVHPKKLSKKKYINSGVLVLDFYKSEIEHSFMDYITGGMQIHCTIAVDFTASNGDPRSPQSLHYNHPHQPNQYEQAIRAVGEIIQDYDSDKQFPVLGFGAKVPPHGNVSHEFFLNGSTDNPFCYMIEGVVNTYRYALNTVQLYGPTNFAPTVNHVARFAHERQAAKSDYFILLIITDGIITDMDQTKAAIVNAATLPISIIIIGVGDADFTDMNILDGDEERLSYRGAVAERDIVQFVPFKQFMYSGRANVQTLKAQLAREVLAEVPDQFLSYMKKNHIRPKPPLERKTTSQSMMAAAAPM